MSGSYLDINNTDPVELHSLIDGNGDLQYQHGTHDLSRHCDTMHVELHGTGDTVTVKLFDVTVSGVSWTISASHTDPATNTRVDWSRASDHAYVTFIQSATNPIEIDTVAEDDLGAKKTKKLYCKPKPKDGLPDHPPRASL